MRIGNQLSRRRAVSAMLSRAAYISDRFGDNMFMGAINAYTDEAGKGLNVLSGETGRGLLEDRSRLQGKGRQVGRRLRLQCSTKSEMK